LTIAELIDKTWGSGNDEAAIALADAMDIEHCMEIHDLENLECADAPDNSLSELIEYDDGSFSVYGYACVDEQGNEVSGPLSAEAGTRLLQLNARRMN
jgi:hypothetical protein